ncbi:DUF3054 domain-containing protein [Nigerium massiliense]|uniref:DUF3054 domain-containing protein n=1 Tax=Nigerium massiliense TaxID=1522317 RepID=UPI00058EA6E5|nr:DUF3054 domain-containing protein [Nigerium massiliense]
MPTILAVLLDLVAVGLFSMIGLASHGEPLAPDAVVRVAAPFVLATLMGWIVLMLRRFTDSLWWQGLTVWAFTLTVGMLVRGLLGMGVQVSFVIVAAVFLAAVMFGWRGIARLVLRRRERSVRVS